MEKPYCQICEQEYPEGTATCPKDGVPLIFRKDDPMAGVVLDGRFKIEYKIGEGGMGAVYRAEQISTGKSVAIKVIAQNLTKSEESVQRFRREVKLQSKLEHPNVVTLIDFAKNEDGQYFFVMPFVEGVSLRKRIRDGGKMSLDDFYWYAGQALDGLEYAHRQGVVHRDIKDDNFFIATMGHQKILKILDFGLAKASRENSTTDDDSPATAGMNITQVGRVIGTPAFMSPEQAMGEVDKIGPRSDIYSLGIVFYQMLSGRLPFEHATPWGVMDMHIHENPQPLKKYNSKVSSELEQIVMRMLEKDQDRRYPSALSVKLELERVSGGALAADPSEELSDDILVMAAPSPMKQKSIAGLVILLLLLLTSATILWRPGEKVTEVEKEVIDEAIAEANQLRAANVKRIDLAERREIEVATKERIEKARQAEERQKKAEEQKTRDENRQVLFAEYLGIADHHLEQGDIDRAKQFTDKAENIFPESPEVIDLNKRLANFNSVSGDPVVGEKIFNTSGKCKICHKLTSKDGVGPGLIGVTLRRPVWWLKNWLKDPQKTWEQNDPITAEMKKWKKGREGKKKTKMIFRALTDVDIDNLIVFLQKNDESS